MKKNTAKKSVKASRNLGPRAGAPSLDCQIGMAIGLYTIAGYRRVRVALNSVKRFLDNGGVLLYDGFSITEDSGCYFVGNVEKLTWPGLVHAIAQTDPRELTQLINRFSE